MRTLKQEKEDSSLSVTRIGRILPLWQNILVVFGPFLVFLFSIFQTCVPSLSIFKLLGTMFALLKMATARKIISTSGHTGLVVVVHARVASEAKAERKAKTLFHDERSDRKRWTRQDRFIGKKIIFGTYKLA